MNNLILFFKRYSHVFLFVALEAIAIVLIVQNSYYQSSKLISWGNRIAGTCYNGVSSVTNYFKLAETNRQLVEENARLRNQLASSYTHYTKEVFTVNDTVYKRQYSYIEAQIIKNSYNKRGNYIMINKGTSQGIKNDMAVMSPQGIVGVVVNTTSNFATVMSLLHPDSRNSVKIKRTNISGSLMWDGKDFRYGTLLDIPTTHKLYKNDTIITSGYSQEFPEGIVVGYIESATKNSGDGFYTIKIRLATDFNKIDYVYVINNRFYQEQQILNTKIAEYDEQQTDNQ
ncbi:MAG: rod shape-determining protein MreC [Bacteroidales bacterium]|nr:rod shape-determining protein MreC [Bacteroidales bacterium]